MVWAAFDILWGQLLSLRTILTPSFLSKKPHFNFITVHYFWVVGLSILASVLLFATAGGQLAYIDALFFAVGANTQAGLNPVDVNKLNTFQQVVILLCSMTSNPIAINSFVVFLRLFWFEKKFQTLVRNARTQRATITKSRSQARFDNPDTEKGVNGRDIRVMHDGPVHRITNDGFAMLAGANGNGNGNGNGKVATAGSSSGCSPSLTPSGEAEAETEAEAEADADDQSIAPDEHERGPGITFAGTVKRSDGMQNQMLKGPEPRTYTDEDHIAILQRQRNSDNDEVLHIPGPRDVELGQRPRRVEGDAPDDSGPLSPRDRRHSDGDGHGDGHGNGEAQTPGRPTITIQEPAKRPSRKEELNDDVTAFINVFSLFKFRRPRVLNAEGDKLHHGGASLSRIRSALSSVSRDKHELAPYLSWQPTVGRNSAFVGELTDEQREELGGIEYRSLKTLSLILTFYFWGFWILAIVFLTPWIIHYSYYGAVVDNIGQNRAWWGIFTGSSAFTDLGFTLTPDSMNQFNTAVYPLLIMSFFIVIGNTGFPVMLRFIIWISSLFAPQGGGLWEELRFLLDHPRRCFTLLFPSAATWWLFWLLVILNGLDLILFIVLDLGSGVVADLPTGIKILDGVFQAFSTRTAGFACVNLANLHPGVQTSYMIMMYISIFPIAISVRRTNVYEEQSLGVYHGDRQEHGQQGGSEDNKEDEQEPEAAGSLSYVGAHLRRQLSFDLWYIFIGFFILSISDGDRVMNGDISMFSILFEIVSAYGTVGLSLGYAGLIGGQTVNASLSSQFSVVGKLVIIAMQIRGRHRGLPYGLDRAVLLPSDKEAQAAALPKARTLPRRNSAISLATIGGRASRARSRSIDLDKKNSNLLTSLLHPGPAVPHPPKRVMSDPVASDDNDEDQVGFPSTRSIGRRSETFSLSRRSANTTRGREEV